VAGALSEVKVTEEGERVPDATVVVCPVRPIVTFPEVAKLKAKYDPAALNVIEVRGMVVPLE